MTRTRWTRLAGRIGFPAIAVLLVWAAWEAAGRIFHVESYVIPSPGATFSSLTDNWSTLRGLTLSTLQECALGFVTGVATGFLFAVLMAHIPVLQRIFYPILIATQAIPIVALAAPLVIILGFGMAPKLVIVGLIVFFPVVVNVLDGLTGVDKDMIALARSMGGGPVKVFLLIRLPATLTPLFSALKLSATYTVTGAVIGEWTASENPGIGQDLLLKNSRLDAAGVYADVLLLTVIGLGGFLLISLIEHILTPWRSRSTARQLPWRRSATAAADATPTPNTPVPAMSAGGKE
jgi:ABC-type nitrate/sulfonate/bicarbonate transport system permease component